MIRFRSISFALFVAALAVSAHAQGTTGGLLYASDFANWTLPQGNTPAQGAITYPNQDICRVTSNGYTFLAPKVGRPITIVDGANTETVTPTSVVVGSIGCIISAVMTHSHSSYFLKSGTGGAQEAVDYQASQPQGANVVLTPAWTAAGGTTGTITGTLKGNNGVTLLDQRTAIITPYGWNGANYVAQPLGGSNISGLTNGLIPLATSPTGITANSHLDDGVTTPATITASEPIAGTGATFSGNVAALTMLPGSVPELDVRNPSFAGGAVCDNATDIGPSIQAALDALPKHGGIININAPGSIFDSPAKACYWANPNTLNYGIHNGAITFKFYGSLRTGTTWTLPTGFLTNILGNGGGSYSAFQTGGLPATLTVSTSSSGAPGTNTGTLGTATAASTGSITSGSGNLTLTDCTQPFTVGQTIIIPRAKNTAEGSLTTVIQSGSGCNWVVSPVASANATSVSVGSVTTVTPSNMAGLVTGSSITVVGTTTCTISTITRTSNKVTAVLSGSCHIPPFVPLTIAGVTDSTFNGSHAVGSILGPWLATSSDYVTNTMTWLQSAAANASSTGGTVTGFNEDDEELTTLSNCTLTTCDITSFVPHSATDTYGLNGMNLNGNGRTGLFRDFTVIADGTAFWINQVYQTRFEKVGTSANGACSNNLASQAVGIGASTNVFFEGVGFNATCFPWAVRLALPYSVNIGFSSAGPIYFNDSFLSGGIKLDHGGFGVAAKNTWFEEVARGVFQIDMNNYWNGNQQWVTEANGEIQDNNYSFPNRPWVYALTPSYSGLVGTADIRNGNSGIGSVMTNDYYNGQLKSDTPLATYDLNVSRGIYGTHVGKVIEGEVRGEGAGMGPSVVPYTTVNVTTNPASWTGGGCTVTTGLLAPDGSLTAGSATVGNSSFNVGTNTFTPAVGDVILFGGWVYTPTHGAQAFSGSTSASIMVDNAASTHYSLATGNISGSSYTVGTALYDPQFIDDWWHPIAGYTYVTASDGTAAQVARLRLNCDASKTLEYWDPWMIVIPASANVPTSEILRWRSQLLHAYVPPGAPARAAATDPNALIYPGTASLYDFDPTTPLNGQVPQYNSGTHKYVPATLAGTGTMVGPISSVAHDLVGFADTGGQNTEDTGILKSAVATNQVPEWLTWLGDGSEAAPTCTSGCTATGEHWYASLTVPAGQVMSLNSGQDPLIIRSTGKCTVAGTISVSPNTGATGINQSSSYGGCGGGGGFGASNGAAGGNCTTSPVGTAGTTGAPGGAGGNFSVTRSKMLTSGGPLSFLNPISGTSVLGGSAGGLGQANGTAAPKGAALLVLDCAEIDATGGVFDATGVAGAAGGLNIGANGGSGGGIVILRTPKMDNAGTVNVTGGAGGTIGTGTSTAGGKGGDGFSKVFSQ